MRLGYADRPSVVEADLTIDRGEVVAVVGPNGSGKSTLVRSVFGLAQVQAGSVEIFGTDRRRFRDWSRVGYVPQRNTVVGGIPSTVREVVTAGLVAGRHWLRPLRSADRARVEAAIASVGLDQKTGEPIATLSGGQQRRVLIARALAPDPELLVLDEPTAGVDVENQQTLATILGELAAAGTTLVLVTHEMGPTRPIITRTIAMRDGAVAYDGPESGAPDEHDDAWHHEHGHEPERSSGTGLEGFGS
ncbi:MAG: metal ABC transporter ATP-binding protein [Actinobacteria bacterium]|nr:metal ABC transporter ATP-binding protein [Actinomycetota bacterium]